MRLDTEHTDFLKQFAVVCGQMCMTHKLKDYSRFKMLLLYFFFVVGYIYFLYLRKVYEYQRQ